MSQTFVPSCQSETFQLPEGSEFQTLATMHFALFITEELAAQPKVRLPDLPNTCVAE